MDNFPAETNLLIARTPTGLIVRGGPGATHLTRGAWSVVLDDLGSGTATHSRLERILRDVELDPLSAVLRNFRGSALELFAIVGPPGVIAGSAPDPSRHRVSVWADACEGVVALGFGAVRIPPEWLSLRSGTAVCWGHSGPEAMCYMGRHAVEAWAPFELAS